MQVFGEANGHGQVTHHQPVNVGVGAGIGQQIVADGHEACELFRAEFEVFKAHAGHGDIFFSADILHHRPALDARNGEVAVVKRQRHGAKPTHYRLGPQQLDHLGAEVGGHQYAPGAGGDGAQGHGNIGTHAVITGQLGGVLLVATGGGQRPHHLCHARALGQLGSKGAFNARAAFVALRALFHRHGGLGIAALVGFGPGQLVAQAVKPGFQRFKLGQLFSRQGAAFGFDPPQRLKLIINCSALMAQLGNKGHGVLLFADIKKTRRSGF